MFVIRAEDWPYQAGDQAMGLEQAVDRGFRNEIALGVGEDECQLARRQGRLVKGQWGVLSPDRQRHFHMANTVFPSSPQPAPWNQPVRLRPSFIAAYAVAPSIISYPVSMMRRPSDVPNLSSSLSTAVFPIKNRFERTVDRGRGKS